ncbi:ankyrin repeat domain-containing protein [Actinoplanes subglobosus]|uniref:Ankyrin repeat domain-containing protein n=1 Tax=Actinoplanes subglobosus TaxID=1547892 RepID=A0ABV8IQB8_9ACTN
MSGYDPLALADWARIRRYAVPGWMIAEATAARERGDWRAACEAALVDVHITDPAPVADLLAGLAPDLLRWHLPRALGGSTELASDRTYLLETGRPITPGAPVLVARVPARRPMGDPLIIEVVPAGSFDHAVPRAMWDARYAAGLPGSLVDRSPIDGSLVDGSLVDGSPINGSLVDGSLVDGSPINGSLVDGSLVDGSPANSSPANGSLVDGSLIDTELVRRGMIRPGALHPLVRAVLFPDAVPEPPEPIVPAGFATEERVRVRCGGGWHAITLGHGRLGLPDHTDAERRRERSLRAFGGVTGGCFNTELAWCGGDSRPPKRVRAYRRDLWLRMRHGGTRVVLELLDAGMDPDIRDNRGRTLLHRLNAFDHTRLLPRLLAAGVDVNTRDRLEMTPLFEAVWHRWPADVAMALADAGADPRMRVMYMSILSQLDIIERDGADDGWTAVIAKLRERA